MTADFLAALLLALLIFSPVLPAWLWVQHRPDLYGWWHATRVAEAMRWRRDGCSWSVAWVRSGGNVHDGENFDRWEGWT